MAAGLPGVTAWNDGPWADWVTALQLLADADDADPAARATPSPVVDGGPWRGPSPADWYRRMAGGQPRVRLTGLRVTRRARRR